MRAIMREALRCQYCEKPQCSTNTEWDIRGITRRVAVGNFAGAEKLARQFLTTKGLRKTSLAECQKLCVLNKDVGSSVEIQKVVNYITEKQ
jgi:NADPH-dependent glutamate synthase beta subunit-like oxidoreductase